MEARRLDYGQFVPPRPLGIRFLRDVEINRIRGPWNYDLHLRASNPSSLLLANTCTKLL